MNNEIIITGAKEHNLKNINVTIPKNKLIVITGVSGSGKSSLAFDTIYEEGKRRYIESLSSYARYFLGGNKKPNVDSIEGLCPTISIDQKTTSNNPRSTIGTITEIYDYLRILFAKIGTPYCPNGHGKIETLTITNIFNNIKKDLHDGDKLEILAPIIRRTKGSFVEELEKLRKDGFYNVLIDNIEYSLDDDIKLEKNIYHNISIIVDKIIYHDDQETNSKIFEDLELCIKYANGNITTLINSKEKNYSQSHSCKICGFSIPEIEPRLFSFNSPLGACPTCNGLGFNFEPDINKIIPDKTKSIMDGGIDFFKNTLNTNLFEWKKFEAMLKHYKIDPYLPIEELSNEQLEIIMYGSKEPIYVKWKSNTNTYEKNDYIEGVAELIKRRHQDTESEAAREYYEKYLSQIKCKHCNGKKLSNIALSIKINDKSIIDITEMNISDAIKFFLDLKLDDTQKQIAELALKEIVNRLSFLENVGLNYLTLSRNANTLSGGESQRIRLASQIGSHLTGILYVLDEPSIGLHQKDNDMLLKTLKNLRDLGNTVIVVEHDLETIENADQIIEIGPGAGVLGGEIIAQGDVEKIKKTPQSLTGKYLTGELNIPIPDFRRSGNGRKIILKGANENNLKNVNLTIPCGKFVCITGVSGSGKSTLINEVLVKNINKILFNKFTQAPKIHSIDGIAFLDKLVIVDQEPIGQTPRSNPATYVGVFDDIRELFSQLPESIIRGYKKSRFSFNVPGGRCEKCQGDGYIKVEMNFLPTVYVKCDECDGKRFNQETLSIKYKDKNIADVLEMNVDEALEFFKSRPNIREKLKVLSDVGLGYLQLGLSATKLSGGEAQRIKLAKFLQKKTSKNSLLILDEPTTGLHIHDVKKLINIINSLVDNGTTVIVIEHNLDLIKCADHIIDLGPNGGINGGEIIATGTPEQIITKDDISYTAKYLKKILK